MSDDTNPTRRALHALRKRREAGAAAPPPENGTPVRLPPAGGLTVTKPPAPLGAAKPAPAVVRYTCGHEKHVRELEHLDCPQCRDERRREKARRKRAAGPRRRLPDKARFVKTYDAATETYAGELTVPLPGGGLLVYTGREGGESRLEEVLGRQHFAYEDQQAAGRQPEENHA